MGVAPLGDLRTYGYREDRSGRIGLEVIKTVEAERTHDVGNGVKLMRVAVGDQTRLTAARHQGGRIASVGYNDAYAHTQSRGRSAAATSTRAGERAGGGMAVAEARAVKLEGLDELHNGKKETLVKYFWGAIAPNVYDAEPHMVGFEVSNAGRVETGATLRPALAEAVGVTKNHCARMYYAHTAFDILAVDNRGRLIIAEIENRDLKPA